MMSLFGDEAEAVRLGADPQVQLFEMQIKGKSLHNTFRKQQASLHMPRLRLLFTYAGGQE